MGSLRSLTADAACTSGIQGNGTGGISINVNAEPYTKSAWANYGDPYGTGGCTWFVGARVMQLTGKGSYNTQSPATWYNSYGQSLGFTKGTAFPSGKAIIVYSTHVAILENVQGSTAYISEGGSTYYSDQAHGYTVIRSMDKSKVTSGGFVGSGSFVGFVYLTKSFSTAPWYSPYGPIYLGDDFYARIVLNSTKVPVTVNTDTMNVENSDKSEQDLIDYTPNKASYWHFIRNADKSYRILNTYWGNRPLEAVGTTSGSNVKLGDVYTGSASQNWTLYDPNQMGTGHYLVRNMASEFVLNVSNESGAPGANLQIWKYTNSGAEHMLIERHSLAEAGTLSVTPGDITEATTFTWTPGNSEAKWYDLTVIRILETGESDPYVFDTNLVSTTASINLPVGDYIAKVTFHGFINEVEGDTVSFTVTCPHKNTEIRNAKEATCNETGYTGDNYCKDCNTLLETGSIISKKAHSWDNGKVTKEATTSATGIKTYSCTECGQTRTETIPQIISTKTSEETEVKYSTETKPSEETKSSSGTDVQKGTTSSVKPVSVRIVNLKLNGISKKIAVGKRITLSATILPNTATTKKLKWTSSNKKIATVNQKGVVSIKNKTGGKSVIITAASTDGSDKKAIWKIKVMKGVVKKITVKGQNSTIKVNKTMKLKATVTATAGANKKLIWTTSNKKWATVSSKGVVKALEAGKGKTVKITVSSTDGSNIKKVVKFKIR